MVFLHTCEACGADAAFGVDVSFRLALRHLEAGNVAVAKRHLGRWYCVEHRPAIAGPA